MPKLIAYFEGAAKDLTALINEPTGGIAQMAAVLSANATMVRAQVAEDEVEPKLSEDGEPADDQETLEEDTD